MRKISIFNIKGGVGKTISTINISAVLAEKGYKVLVVDMDSQSSTSISFEGYSADDKNIGDLLVDNTIDAKEVIKHTNVEGIDILPCNFELPYKEREISITYNVNQQLRLRNVLMKIEADEELNYDYCIIDCPPAVGLMAINSLVASDDVLIPIKIDRYAYDGIGRLIEEIEAIQKELNPNLKLAGCFVTLDSRTSINSLIKEILEENLGEKLLKTSVRQTTSVVESTFENMPVVTYKKKATASIDYRNLVKEVFNV